MYFILQGETDRDEKDEVEGRKIEMTEETDWRRRGASKSVIKKVFVLDY